VNQEKVVTLLLVGFGILGILYYLGKKKPLAAPGAGGPNANAGGGSITPAVRSASAGVSGSIPNIIASAAALSGQSFGSIFARQEQTAGVAPKPGTLTQSTYDPADVFYDTTKTLTRPPLLDLQPSSPSSTFQSGVTGSIEVPFPGLTTDYGPDVSGLVSALDVGGTDYSSLYV
jgi:hypothetical protein